jgi:hypothetical protein
MLKVDGLLNVEVETIKVLPAMDTDPVGQLQTSSVG